MSRRAPTAKSPTVRISIDELARRTGFSVRNLRAMQTRGILAPPQMDGRKGVYSEGHLARVALIKRLQSKGYSLSAIVDLIAQWERKGSAELGAVEAAIAAPASSDARTMEHEAIVTLLPALASNPAIRQRAIELGLVIERDGALFAPRAMLIESARAFLDAGLPWEGLFEGLGVWRAHADAVAESFRQQFERYFFAGLRRDGLSPDKLDALATLVRALRPASMNAFVALLAQSIEHGGALSLLAAAPLSDAP